MAFTTDAIERKKTKEALGTFALRFIQEQSLHQEFTAFILTQLEEEIQEAVAKVLGPAEQQD
jgi:hypothetical protein